MTDTSDAGTDWGRAVEKPLVCSADGSCATSEQVTSRVNVAIVGGGLIGLAVAIGLDREKELMPWYTNAPHNSDPSSVKESWAFNPMAVKLSRKYHQRYFHSLPKRAVSV
jgi:hypothetical protein